MERLKGLPLWFLMLCVAYIGVLLTYAVVSGRQVKFFPPEIGSTEQDSTPNGRPGDGLKTELWTIQGSVGLKTYDGLRPLLTEHVHELLLRVNPPIVHVDTDGTFTITNVPLIVGGRQQEPLLEIYPQKDIQSQGYRAESVRISRQRSTFGAERQYSLDFDGPNKTVIIRDTVSIKNPSKELAAAPYSPATADKPEGTP